MKKLVDFLEVYVQWVALGLAILWIGWITYAYWWVSPVTAEFDGQKITPANINHEVDQTVAIPLEARISDPHVPFADHTVANELRRFHNNIEVASVLPEVLGTLAKIEERNTPSLVGETQLHNALKPDISDVIALYDPAVAMGMSRVEIADEKGGKAYKGTTWATVSAEFSQAAFAKAWSDAKIPAAAQLTFFLRVQLVREEFVEGEWTNSTVIHELPIKGHELPAMPSDPPTTQATMVYDKLAPAKTEDIIEPPFYPVDNGAGIKASDPWRTVNMPQLPGLFQMKPAFRPGINTPKTPEEFKMLDDWNKKQKEAEAKRIQAEKAARQAAAGTVARSPTYTTPTPPVSSRRTSTTPPRKVPPKPPVPLPPSPLPTVTPTTQATTPVVAPLPAAAKKMLPNAMFIPIGIQDTEIWAHDDTCESGHMYRYMIRLFMRNPLYNTVNIAANQKDTVDYALVTETDWSEPVLIPATTYFFFTKDGGVGIAGGRPEVVIYEWKDGNWTKNPPIKIEPGDAIGKTGCTLVDTRSSTYRNGGQTEILIRQPNGALMVRTVKGDGNNLDWRLLEQFSTAPAVSSAVPPH